MNCFHQYTPDTGDYRLERPIGQGACGRVWLGRNVLGQLRAVKTVERGWRGSDGAYGLELRGLEHYEPLSRSHPGLMGILHVGLCNRPPGLYYVMELADDVKGGGKISSRRYRPATLQAEMEGGQRFPVRHIVYVTQAIARGLQYLHENGLVHRDVKPSNVLFVQGQPKLADAGLVSLPTQTCGTQGTPQYLPPEGSGCPSGDIFSLGMLLKEMLRHPQSSPSGRHHAESTLEEGLYTRLKQIADRACRFEPSQRYPSARDFADVLAAGLVDEPAQGWEVPSGTSSAPRSTSALQRVVIVGDTQGADISLLAQHLETELAKRHCSVFVERTSRWTSDSARQLEDSIAEADAVVALLSPQVLHDEKTAYELYLARRPERTDFGKPRLVSVLVGVDEWPGFHADGALDGAIPQIRWTPGARPPGSEAQGCGIESVCGEISRTLTAVP